MMVRVVSDKIKNIIQKEHNCLVSGNSFKRRTCYFCQQTKQTKTMGTKIILLSCCGLFLTLSSPAAERVEESISFPTEELQTDTLLTLEKCCQMAHDNYPAIRQYGLVEKLRSFTVENVAKGWLPRIGFSAGGFAFTDLLNASAATQQMGLEMENYLLSGSVTVTQPLYDGGQIAAGKRVTDAQGEVQKQQVAVTMYAVRERVEQLFFSILLLDEQLSQNNLLQSDLAISEKSVKSWMEGGVANQGDWEAVRVEQLKAEQQADQLQASRETFLRMLSLFVGQSLTEYTAFERPSADDHALERMPRPEMLYYASQDKLLEQQRKQLDSRLRPTLSLMGVGLVHSDLVTIAQQNVLLKKGIVMGGLSFSWNIGAWYTRKNDIRKLETEREMNDTRRRLFLFNNQLQSEESDGQIRALRQQVARDVEIVQLRQSIRAKSDAKVAAGTESVNELLRDIHAVHAAEGQQSIHEVELLQAIYRSRTIHNDMQK